MDFRWHHNHELPFLRYLTTWNKFVEIIWSDNFHLQKCLGWSLKNFWLETHQFSKLNCNLKCCMKQPILFKYSICSVLARLTHWSPKYIKMNTERASNSRFKVPYVSLNIKGLWKHWYEYMTVLTPKNLQTWLLIYTTSWGMNT